MYLVTFHHHSERTETETLYLLLPQLVPSGLVSFPVEISSLIVRVRGGWWGSGGLSKGRKMAVKLWRRRSGFFSQNSEKKKIKHADCSSFFPYAAIIWQAPSPIERSTTMCRLATLQLLKINTVRSHDRNWWPFEKRWHRAECTMDHIVCGFSYQHKKKQLAEGWLIAGVNGILPVTSHPYGQDTETPNHLLGYCTV